MPKCVPDLHKKVFEMIMTNYDVSSFIDVIYLDFQTLSINTLTDAGCKLHYKCIQGVHKKG